MSDCSLEMPKYQCHKKVWALKIQQVYFDGSQNLIVPADYGYDDFSFSGIH
jgi:inorganic pyrophosphatase